MTGTAPDDIADVFASARERITDDAAAAREPNVAEIEGDDPDASDAHMTDAPRRGRKPKWRNPEEAKIAKNARERATRSGDDPHAAAARAVAEYRRSVGDATPIGASNASNTARAAATSRTVNTTRAALADDLASERRARAAAESRVAELEAAKDAEAGKAIAGMLAKTFDLGAKLLARKRGDHWRISEEEADALGEAWAAPLTPYLAQLAEYSPWIVAAMATVNVVAPRLIAEAEIAEGKSVAIHAGPPPVAGAREGGGNV
jgi:hypothetical protein